MKYSWNRIRTKAKSREYENENTPGRKRIKLTKLNLKIKDSLSQEAGDEPRKRKQRTPLGELLSNAVKKLDSQEDSIGSSQELNDSLNFVTQTPKTKKCLSNKTSLPDSLSLLLGPLNKTLEFKVSESKSIESIYLPCHFTVTQDSKKAVFNVYRRTKDLACQYSSHQYVGLPPTSSSRFEILEYSLISETTFFVKLRSSQNNEMPVYLVKFNCTQKSQFTTTLQEGAWIYLLDEGTKFGKHIMYYNWKVGSKN